MTSGFQRRIVQTMSARILSRSQMRRDVEDAAEHIQLLERELNLGRVHWRRKTSRRRFDGAKRRCAHEQNAQRAANNFRTPISHERYIPTRLVQPRRLLIDVLLR